MFGALFTTITGGKPLELVALGLGVLLLVGGAFGAGALWQANKAITNIATVATQAAPKAAAAQHKSNTDRKKKAIAADAPIRKADKAHDDKAEAIYHALADLPATPGNSCPVSVDVLKLLNEAGRY
jgi:predicted lipid-binding transport protein (Tim44 family)